jgi:hypothetical protein
LLFETKDSISRTLQFKNQHQGNDEAYYEEQTPNGPVMMCRNKRGEVSYVDLEVLFNATLSNPSLIASLFSHQ